MRVRDHIRKLAERSGYAIFRKPRGYDDFWQLYISLDAPENRQTPEQARAYAAQYAEPMFPAQPVMALLGQLEQVVDPSDQTLGNTNQLQHLLQILNRMDEDGLNDPDFLIAGLIHDLGKLLLLTDMPMTVALGRPRPLGTYPKGVGLDNCTFRWTLDEYAYQRLKDHLPRPIAWLVRYHSIELKECLPLMNEEDRSFTEKYFRPFFNYDQFSKSPYFEPPNRLEQYQAVVERYFPEPIAF